MPGKPRSYSCFGRGEVERSRAVLRALEIPDHRGVNSAKASGRVCHNQNWLVWPDEPSPAGNDSKALAYKETRTMINISDRTAIRDAAGPAEYDRSMP